MLRQEKEAAGRLWLMLRFLDQPGQGVIRIDIINQHLNSKTSNLYLCGKRQLRNLLRAGEGVYWTRDKEQVWLRSTARVAAALGVERLTGRPVALPLSALLDGHRRLPRPPVRRVPQRASERDGERPLPPCPSPVTP
jgi:hypothetical protein